MTKTNQVLEAFQNGEELTAAQISARYSVADPHAMVRSLRGSGYCIYLNKRKNSKGEVMQKYRLGTPTRKVIAAGIAALGAEAAGLV
jgi:predicted transcriptional regulator